MMNKGYLDKACESDHQRWMKRALVQACLARDNNEVPVGAVLVDCETGKLLAESYNQSIGLNDPTAHAEIMVLRKAAAAKQNYRLPRTAIYVTIEPCTMCVGAMYHSRVDAVIFGAKEPRAGALVSQICLAEKSFYNHRLDVLGGVLEDQCATVISNFFKGRRIDAEKELAF